MQVKRAFPWCLLVFLFFVGLTIGNVDAETEVFVLEPKQEVTRSLRLTVSDSVFGNISVVGGLVDLYVTSPTEAVVFYHNETTSTDFNFTASENGNYTMHFLNSLSSANMTVILDYSVNFEVVLQENINVGFSTGVVYVSAIPFPVKRLKPKVEDVNKLYVNLRESQKILNIVRGIWKDMPLGSFVWILSLKLLALFCYRSVRKSSLNMTSNESH